MIITGNKDGTTLLNRMVHLNNVPVFVKAGAIIPTIPIKLGNMFGFTTISIDAKGRLAIPAKYRDHLQAKQETQIVVTRDPQYPALKIYPGSEWIQIAHGLQSLQGLDPIVRNLQWTILGNASVSEFDPSGRMLILVPSELREYADINSSNKVALVGMGNKFEIWNDQNWEMRQTGGSLSTEILEVVLPESIKTMTF
jgi:MraZ protein